MTQCVPMRNVIGTVELAKRLRWKRKTVQRWAEKGKIVEMEFVGGKVATGAGNGYTFKDTPKLALWILSHRKTDDEIGGKGRPSSVVESQNLLLNAIHYPLTEAAQSIEAATGIADLSDALTKIGTLGSDKFVRLGKRLRNPYKLSQFIIEIRGAASGLQLAASLLEKHQSRQH
jgi:hypothetical protein